MLPTIKSWLSDWNLRNATHHNKTATTNQLSEPQTFWTTTFQQYWRYMHVTMALYVFTHGMSKWGNVTLGPDITGIISCLSDWNLRIATHHSKTATTNLNHKLSQSQAFNIIIIMLQVEPKGIDPLLTISSKQFITAGPLYLLLFVNAVNQVQT